MRAVDPVRRRSPGLGRAAGGVALAYARTLSELGHASEAAEILAEVVRVSFDAFERLPRIALGASLATA